MVVWLSNTQGEVQFMGTEVINGSNTQTDSLVTVFMYCEFHSLKEQTRGRGN